MTNKEKTQIQDGIVDKVQHPHGRLLLAPRVGKSRIAIQIIKKFKPKSVLWATPSANLAKTDIPLEFEKWGAKRYLKKLTTCTYKSLPKMLDHFDLIILDEEQHLTEANSQRLIQNGNYGNILSMTGTPTKHRKKLDLYKQLKLSVIYEMKINDAVDLGILANYETTVLMIPREGEKTKKFDKVQKSIEAHIVGTCEFRKDHIQLNGKFQGTLGLSERESKYGGKMWAIINKNSRSVGYFVQKGDGSEFGKIKLEGEDYQFVDGIMQRPIPKFLLLKRKQEIGNSEVKEEVARDLLKRLGDSKKIIFCNSIEQAEKLSPGSTFHSKTSNKDLGQFMGNKHHTIAMVGKGGTGFTYKSLQHLIIVQAGSDKNGSTSQKICRTLLQQKDYKAQIWILCLEGTQDEVWVNSTLKSFDSTKVKFQKYEYYEKD